MTDWQKWIWWNAINYQDAYPQINPYWSLLAFCHRLAWTNKGLVLTLCISQPQLLIALNTHFATINQDTLNIEACTSLSLVTVPLYYKRRLLLRVTAIGIDLFCRQCCCCCTVLCMSIQPQQQQEITVTNGVAPHNLSLFAQNVTNNSPNHFLFQLII